MTYRYNPTRRTPTTLIVPVEFGPLGEQEVTVRYYYTPADPGKTSGPPENCYPPEPSEIEIEDAFCHILSDGGNAILLSAFDNLMFWEEIERSIEEHEQSLQEAAEEAYCSSYDD